jgi:hypothetical protein
MRYNFFNLLQPLILLMSCTTSITGHGTKQALQIIDTKNQTLNSALAILSDSCSATNCGSLGG